MENIFGKVDELATLPSGSTAHRSDLHEAKNHLMEKSKEAT